MRGEIECIKKLASDNYKGCIYYKYSNETDFIKLIRTKLDREKKERKKAIIRLQSTLKKLIKDIEKSKNKRGNLLKYRIRWCFNIMNIVNNKR